MRENLSEGRLETHHLGVIQLRGTCVDIASDHRHVHSVQMSSNEIKTNIDERGRTNTEAGSDGSDTRIHPRTENKTDVESKILWQLAIQQNERV